MQSATTPRRARSDSRPTRRAPVAARNLANRGEPLLNTTASAAPVPTTKIPSATTAANREAGDAADRPPQKDCCGRQDRRLSQFQLVIESPNRSGLAVNLRGQRRDARAADRRRSSRSQAPRHDAHDRGEGQRDDGDDDQGDVHRGLNGAELHRDFDDDVYRCAQTLGGRSAIGDRLHGAFVETRAEAPHHLDVANRSVPPHDNFQHDVADDITLPCFLGVIGFHFAQKPRGLDAAARTEWTAARAASRSWSDAGAVAFADSSSLARAGAAACARTVTVGLGRGLLERAGTVAHIGGRGNDRHQEGRQPFGVERRRFRLGRCRRRHDRLWRLTPGSGLLMCDVLRGVSWEAAPVVSSPPPPPPPPGPGVAMKMNRVGS